MFKKDPTLVTQGDLFVQNQKKFKALVTIGLNKLSSLHTLLHGVLHILQFLISSQRLSEYLIMVERKI